jgi:DNA-binding CsgD family transcriptional regulator
VKHDYDLAKIAALPARWYSFQPLPVRLLKKLGQVPAVNGLSASTDPAVDLRKASHSLTKRERVVLMMLSHGMTAQMVAEALGVSYHVVQQHSKAARYVLRAKNTTHACCIAIREGLIS